MCNLLQNIATKQVKKSCCEFYHPHSNLSCNKSVYCLFCTYLNSDWMKLHRVTPYTGVMSLAAKKVCLEPVKRATSRDFVAKSTTTFYFLQQLFAHYDNLICPKTGLKVGSKMHNFAFQLVLQQCCKTSCILTSCLQVPCTQIDSHQPRHFAGPRTHSTNQI